MASLTPLQRAFLAGYRRGARQARRQLCAEFDHELSLLQSDFDDIARLANAERQRYDQIEAALKATRDPDELWPN